MPLARRARGSSRTATITVLSAISSKKAVETPPRFHINRHWHMRDLSQKEEGIKYLTCSGASSTDGTDEEFWLIAPTFHAPSCKALPVPKSRLSTPMCGPLKTQSFAGTCGGGLADGLPYRGWPGPRFAGGTPYWLLY